MTNQGKKKSTKFRGCLIALAVLGVVGTIAFLWIRPDQSSARRALPFSAEDIHEWEKDFGFLPDFTYHLKAKITEEQFHRYVEKLGLTPHPSTREYLQSSVPWLSWESLPGSVGDWWDPSDSLDFTFVLHERDFWMFAKYEHGYLYLTALDH